MSRLLFLISVPLLLCACPRPHTPVPPNTIPKPKVLTSANEQYGHQVLTALSAKYELDYNDPRIHSVKSIVRRLADSAGAGNHSWHVYLFKAPKVKNAAATRGNHIFVWSGIFDLAKNNTELAAVLAHEISHILADHTAPDPNEEIRRMLINLGAIGVTIAVSQAGGASTASANLGQVLGGLTQEIGSGAILYPYTRELEHEADSVGLLLMAEAGYDPKAALSFWERASKDPRMSSSVEFFSSHPLAADRLAKLQKQLPLAMQRYEKHKKQQILNSRKPWRVFADKAVLYSSPNTKGKKLGEFQHGAVVRVAEQKNGWLRIEHPDRGYLEDYNLLPEN